MSLRQNWSRVWLFDLDNTLHNATPYIFPHINRAMTDYIREHLSVSESEATRLRQDYWLRYGATLCGLMRHHGVKPQHFLLQTHQFSSLERMIVRERALRATLRRLPGRKIIFSNAPGHYTEAILELTGIRACFDAVYPLERLRYHPKPATTGFLHLLRDERLIPQRCIMVEDSLPNLETAKRLGMKTVWINAETRFSPSVDVRIRSILDLPERIARLQ